jgi:hypothetical protein
MVTSKRENEKKSCMEWQREIEEITPNTKVSLMLSLQHWTRAVDSSLLRQFALSIPFYRATAKFASG